MSDEPIPSLAEALTEIRRLRERVTALETEEMAPRWARELIEKLRTNAAVAKREADLHIGRLSCRIAELEAAAAITFGTLEQPTPDEPASYTHNVPPSAPPHDE